jgi:uncharacterized protein YfaT (DUF1175 family)
MRILFAGTALAVVLFVASIFVPVSRTAALSPAAIPADGTSSARLIWSVENVFGRPVPYYPPTTRVEVEPEGGLVRTVGSLWRSGGPARLEMSLRAGTQAGEVSVRLHDGADVRSFRLRLLQADGDRDSDGIPDRAELPDRADREAFRSWFVAIAEAQFYAPDRRWDPVHHDCAGLIRFAYKEALRRHDREWLSGIRYLHRPVQRDVRRYHYPDVPVLGERVFRIRPGAYRPGDDLQRDFAPAASARVLWEHNTVFVGRRWQDARPGDLLFFRDPARQFSPMHSMVLLEGRVVYHTGDDEVRMVTIDELNAHRDDRWHVRPDNPHFLGFYRWKILEGGRP